MIVGHNAIENLQAALQRAMEIRPKVGGFPYLAETLHLAGRHPQHLDSAWVSKSVFDGAWLCSDNGSAAGVRHG
jgi:hypothetical protein